MASATIRVREQTRTRLREISEREQRPISAILEAAVRQYDEAAFWATYQKQMADLRADPGAWAEYVTETAEWDTTIADGLDDEPV